MAMSEVEYMHMQEPAMTEDELEAERARVQDELWAEMDRHAAMDAERDAAEAAYVEVKFDGDEPPF